MHFSPTSCYFLPHRSKYSCQQLILKHPQQCSSLRVNPNKIIGKITFLQNMFYIANWKTNDPEINGSKCYLYLIVLLISSWMEFWFVIIIPKYLDFATIWKYFLAVFIILLYPAFWWQDINIIITQDIWKLVPIWILFEYFMGHSLLDTFFLSAGGILVTFKYSASHLLSCCTDFMDLL
jgi:hypothetical protein